jgi:CHAT domain-containing protein
VACPRYIRGSTQNGRKVLPSTVPFQTDEIFDSQTKRIRSRGFSFGRLPGTAAEVQGIATLFKSKGQVAETRLGLDATKTIVLETDLTRYRYLHFATHGVLPTDTGKNEPALVLSLDGRTQRKSSCQ